MKQRFTKRTRLVSALLTLAMVFTFLPFSAFAAEVDVIINSTNFPDYNFRAYLYNKFGTSLSESERNTATEMDLGPNPYGYGMNIENLQGIEYFTKLEILECPLNKITELDTSSNLALKSLGCYRNQLTQLNVSGNNALTSLSCGNNQLTALDVSSNPNLTLLSCRNNQLTSLNLSHNSNLMSLDCDNNQLTFLDLSNNVKLSDNAKLYKDMFKCSGNKYPITIDATKRTFNLNDLPTGFNVNKTSGWVGGSVNGNTLTVDKDANEVTYTYNCGNGLFADFTLVVNGGGSTGGGSTGGGSTGGGSTGGGSTGGGSTGGGSTGGGSTGGGSTGGGSTGGGSTGGGTVPPVTPPSGGGTTIPPEAGKYQLTVTDGVATVNGSTGAVLNVKPGDTVTLTADTTKFPENEEFGWWEITPYGSVSNTLTGQYQRTATFTMPHENVSARAMSKSAGVSTGGDDGGGGGGAAILLVGGAAVAGLVGYGVYSYVSEQQLKALLPEGVAMPENRAQTALLLWNTAGRPEPAEAPAFKDVADPDTAKAAQWCVEHGLMDQKLGGRFAPDNSDPAYKTLNAYQQLVG